MENHDNSQALIVRNLNNVFLIDWLTITFHGLNVWDVREILGMNKIPWSNSRGFCNGYPLDCSFNHIHIRYGADNPAFYDDPSKARNDMGICLDMSGQGCREFESYSSKSWQEFISDVFRCGGVLGARFSVTRLDLAYDDHSGLLNMWQMKRDIEDRNYISKSKKSMIIWSDDQETDVQGLTLQIGSKSSPVLIRIYDKAAERGYGKKCHWIRVELQLRQDRSHEALKLLYQRESIGIVASGIIRNYCCFVTPAADTNRSRWLIAEYWLRVLEGMEKLRVWVAPGEEYNFSKAENHLVHQYGQMLQAYEQIHGEIFSLLDRSRSAHPDLKPKYLSAVEKERYKNKLNREQAAAQMKAWGFSGSDDFLRYTQSNFAELLQDDPNSPW